jgi:hypothetical protein
VAGVPSDKFDILNAPELLQVGSQALGYRLLDGVVHVPLPFLAYFSIRRVRTGANHVDSRFAILAVRALT